MTLLSFIGLIVIIKILYSNQHQLMQRVISHKNSFVSQPFQPMVR